MTQQELILGALEKGERLTKLTMLRRFGIWNSGDQIMKLRRAGHTIKTEFQTKGTKRFAIYELVKEAK